MNKFKIGDRVKVDSELADLFGEGNIGIITDIELRINDAKTELYKVYHIEDKEIDFYAQNLELVETSEEIAVKKFKEKIRKGIQKEMDYISMHYKEIDNHQRCTLELQYCMQLLESEDK